jgi:tetratricopeptide (TPR) repeat protein
VELEVYAARADRDPNNPRLQFEVGMRLKKAGKPKQAITALQAARGDSKRKALVLLELGECFQKIEQYKLALAHYEQSIEATDSSDEETRKLALYRAGVLATGLRELDRAERHLGELAALDYGYRDVADRLDKVAALRDSG